MFLQQRADRVRAAASQNVTDTTRCLDLWMTERGTRDICKLLNPLLRQGFKMAPRGNVLAKCSDLFWTHTYCICVF